MALFRELTMGKPVIMGRRTWESLPRRPLPGRCNIVLSRDGSFAPAGAVVCDNLAEAVEIGREQAADDGAAEVCLIGGAAIFEAALLRARRIYLTEVEAKPSSRPSTKRAGPRSSDGLIRPARTTTMPSSFAFSSERPRMPIADFG
jgi:dihydrofolate reductase